MNRRGKEILFISNRSQKNKNKIYTEYKKYIHSNLVLEKRTSLYSHKIEEILQNFNVPNLIVLDKMTYTKLIKTSNIENRTENDLNLEFQFFIYESSKQKEIFSVERVTKKFSFLSMLKIIISNLQLHAIRINDNINHIYRIQSYRILLNILKKEKFQNILNSMLNKIVRILDRDLYIREEKISNQILLVMKFLLENFPDSFIEVFRLNLLSNSIMYKTWNSLKNTNIVLEILNTLIEIRNKNSLNRCMNDDTITKEFQIIEGLCDHECIRQEIRHKLKTVFGKLN